MAVGEPDAESAEGHRRVIAGVVIAGFCVFLQLYAPQPLLVLFRDTFHASEAQVSLIVSVATLAVALASPFVGMLADAVGRKRVIVPCLFALALATFGCATASNLHQLVVWRFVAGLCMPGVIAVTLAYISEESPAASAGSVVAIYVTGTVLGGLTGRLSAAFVADRFSWRWSFAVLAFLTLVGAICTWRMLPRSRHFQRQLHWHDGFSALGRHLHNKRLLATYFAGFSVLLSHVGLFTYISFHLARPPFSLSTSALGMIFLVYGLGVIVTPLSGRLIDRLGHRAGAALSAGMFIAGAALTLIPNLPLMVMGIAIASSGVFVAQATSSSHIGRAADGAKSAASGLYVAAYYLGGSMGATALVVPWHLGGWPAVVGTIIVVQCLCLVVSWKYYIHETRTSDVVVPVE